MPGLAPREYVSAVRTCRRPNHCVLTVPPRAHVSFITLLTHIQLSGQSTFSKKESGAARLTACDGSLQTLNLKLHKGGELSHYTQYRA